jgi:hypothetical protein
VKRKKMEEADSRQSTADSLKSRTRKEDNAEVLKARRLAENARGIGRLRSAADSLQMAAEDSGDRGNEVSGEIRRGQR